MATSFFVGTPKEELLRLLHVFIKNHNWESVALCADHILEHHGEDFAVACILQRAAMHLARIAAEQVAARTAYLADAVGRNMEAANRVLCANELVRKLEPASLVSEFPPDS